MSDVSKITPETTLVDILENNRGVDRAVTYVDGENSERRVPYGDLHSRALGILYHLQAMGAQRGDKMIIFRSSNEKFLDGFWPRSAAASSRCRSRSVSATSTGT